MRCVGFSGMLWSFVLTLCSPNQPSATHPHFGQTCLFTNPPKFGTTNCGWNVWEIREKAGLSKMGVSCRRLIHIWCFHLLYHLANLLQKDSISRTSASVGPAHHIWCYHLLYHLANLSQKDSISRPTHHIWCYHLLYHLANLSQKDSISRPTHHIWCFHLLYHLANLLQKIASVGPTHHIWCYHLLYHLANLSQKDNISLTNASYMMLSSFVSSCKLVTKDSISRRARNPRFYFVHAGTKPRFLTKRGIKIGDSVLWSVGPTLSSFWLNLVIVRDNSAIDRTRPRNPRLKDVHTGTKLRLGDKKSNRDSGISGSG
jgi:hypothetical protein